MMVFNHDFASFTLENLRSARSIVCGVLERIENSNNFVHVGVGNAFAMGACCSQQISYLVDSQIRSYRILRAKTQTCSVFRALQRQMGTLVCHLARRDWPESGPQSMRLCQHVELGQNKMAYLRTSCRSLVFRCILGCVRI